jgi:cell division protein FtsI/penicillin-binding protein 2/cell division protein FtsW (lipid II flippase)
MEDRLNRTDRTHGLALVYTLIALLVAGGATLATLARVPLSVPSDVININAVGPEGLALALEIDLPLADRIVRERERIGGFESVAQAVTTPIVAEGRGRSQARAALKDLDVNRANAAELSEALHIPLALAERIVQDRKTRGGGRFVLPDQALEVTVLPPSVAAAWKDKLVVLMPGAALSVAACWLIAFLAAMALSAVWSMRSAAGADPWILPLVWLFSGLVFCVWMGIADPLRERMRVPLLAESAAVGVVAMVAVFEISRRWRGGRRSGADRRLMLGVSLLLLWLIACALLRQGRTIGLPGLMWLGPLLTTILLSEFAIASRETLLSANPDRPAAVAGGRPASRRRTLSLWAPGAVALVLYLGSRDAGVCLVGLTAAAFLLTLLTANRSLVVPGTILGLAVVLLGERFTGGGLQVFTEWVSPWVRSGPYDGQLAEAIWAVSSGGFWGSGLGLGNPAAIPRPEDASYAAVAEELGTTTAVVMLLLLSLVLWRTARAGATARENDTRSRAACILALLSAQAIWAFGGPVGALPNVGVPLPFAFTGRLQGMLWPGCVGWLLAVSEHASQMLPSAGRRAYRQRLSHFAGGVAVALVGLLGIRTMYVQVYNADRNAGRSLRLRMGNRTITLENPRLRLVAGSVPRGSIYDSTGRVVATSRLREISEALPDDAAAARRYFRAGRYYPYGAACEPVVGLWAPFCGAQSGVEKELDEHLRGYSGTHELLSVYRAKDLPGWMKRSVPQGRDAVLSIDAEKQKAAQGILARYCRSAHGTREGVLVALHALQGFPIVAATTSASDPNRALLNPMTLTGGGFAGATLTGETALLAPCAVMQLAYALAASPDIAELQVDCDHQLARVTWSDHGQRREALNVTDHPMDAPHGRIKLEEALKVSCNVFFAEAASRMGPDVLYSNLTSLMGGPPTATRDAFGKEMVNLVVGKTPALMSPLQTACLTASVTAQAAPIRPHYWYEKRFRDRESEFVSPAIGEGASLPGLQARAEAVAKALTEAAKDGPLDEILAGRAAGRTATVRPFSAATADDAWFYGYAPVRNPAFVVVVVVRSGVSGYRSAAPAARDMLEVLLGH